MSETSRQPKLIAFAGHRHVPHPQGLRTAVRESLSEMKDALGGRVIAISSAAAGADLIFLRACIDLRIPMIVVIPFPEERFSEDFEDPAEWEMVEKLLGVALAKYITPGGKAAPEAYQAVSHNLLEWADAFLFAWDGKPPLGPGGTGETVQEAQDSGLPARIIEADTLVAKWSIPPDASRKARHGFGTRQDLLDFLDLRFAAKEGSTANERE